MSSSSDEVDQDDIYDLLVVGGGIVGLAVFREAVLAGWKCVLVEREPHLLSWASGSNSGIVCTGVDALPGTLERALIRDSVSRIRLFCQEMNIPHRPCGSLVCRWSWDEEDHLDEILAESHNAGDTHAQKLSTNDVLEKEPNLNPTCCGAVHIPGEIVVDPWLFSIAYAVHARQNGGHIITNFEMDPANSAWSGDYWTVVRTTKMEPSALRAKALVNAAGLWADEIERETYFEPTWTPKPRRGQYRIYKSNSETRIEHPIQPIPTQRTKGIFIFSTLYDQIVVGPTALDQESKIDHSVDPAVSEMLDVYAKRVVPSLDPSKAHIGDYVGIRPGTNRRDYQIEVHFTNKSISCAGVRSTGLTASLGIGRHVVWLLKQGILKESNPIENILTRPLPPVTILAEQFRSQGDGMLQIEGHTYKVTHPTTRLGWTGGSGIIDDI